MRPLFLFLILINAGYFAWQWQQQDSPQTVMNNPIAVVPNSKTLTLLSEAPTAMTNGENGNGAPQESHPDTIPAGNP